MLPARRYRKAYDQNFPPIVGKFPCNQLAAEFFGGGGHLNASGGEFYGTMEEAQKVFEQALEKYKPLLTAKG